MVVNVASRSEVPGSQNSLRACIEELPIRPIDKHTAGLMEYVAILAIYLRLFVRFRAVHPAARHCGFIARLAKPWFD